MLDVALKIILFGSLPDRIQVLEQRSVTHCTCMGLKVSPRLRELAPHTELEAGFAQPRVHLMAHHFSCGLPVEFELSFAQATWTYLGLALTSPFPPSLLPRPTDLWRLIYLTLFAAMQ